MMPTVSAWEPTLHERLTNPASPWVLVRDNCGHTEYLIKRKRIERFSSARTAQAIADKLNQTLYADRETEQVETAEDF